jgi:ubiquinone/menaquinone biosynthesis C-methylase UbiE
MGDQENQRATMRSVWALGDYHAFAKQTVWEVGRELVEAARISPGQRVLDVAAGSGNVAIRAAQAGARVVASDITPENFEAGQEEARAHGVDLEWVEADAQALPFADAEFAVVCSAFGAIFAPDQRGTADEMLRVCRPGGIVAMANFPPVGLAANLFEMLGRHAPSSSPDADSPLLWGDEDHVRKLFGDRVASLDLTMHLYYEHAPTPADYVRMYREAFGPVVAMYDALANSPARLAALERDLLEFAERANTAPPGEPAIYPYEYVVVIGHRR